MRKAIALFLAVCTLLSFAVVASADATFSSSTTLTTKVPSANYVMTIPANQVVDFGATSKEIGTVTITNAAGFAEKKNVEVTVTYTEFTSKTAETTIPYNIYAANERDSKQVLSGDILRFEGKADGTVKEQATYVNNTAQGVAKLRLQILSTNWGKALAGDYTATITFSSTVAVQK